MSRPRPQAGPGGGGLLCTGRVLTAARCMVPPPASAFRLSSGGHRWPCPHADSPRPLQVGQQRPARAPWCAPGGFVLGDGCLHSRRPALEGTEEASQAPPRACAHFMVWGAHLPARARVPCSDALSVGPSRPQTGCARPPFSGWGPSLPVESSGAPHHRAPFPWAGSLKPCRGSPCPVHARPSHLLPAPQPLGLLCPSRSVCPRISSARVGRDRASPPRL